MTRRSDIANEEVTRDPIFLLQARRIVPTNTDRYDYDSDTEAITLDGNIVTLDDMLGNDDAVECWHTESVWLTRPEAETHGRKKAHHYPHGWRVYCVPAEGALAALLNNAEQTRAEVQRLREELSDLDGELALMIEHDRDLATTIKER